MTPNELHTVEEQISEIKTWSPHKKKMYGMAILGNLALTHKPIVASKIQFKKGAPIKKQKTLVVPPSQAEFARDAFELLEQMLELDVIHLRQTAVKKQTPSDDLLRFSYMIAADPEPDTQHILHEQVWIKIIEQDAEPRLTLVATGDFEGDFHYYTITENDEPLQSTISIKGSGLYEIPQETRSSIYMTEKALDY
ncbi:hypothetical protein [Lactococcus termiticola]|uniref:Uncharacterized protein n=1 Tax=Lactococcus termiticola TaxID=2169526 RepID=A0A2R5HJB3_9LACT|nr:hypothetical protein [Lactococcus termiticola]GBG96628.1 hypothetical protein NtB2_00752 [Lactococcus termiticola]